MSAPLVSIIIPCHNADQYVAEAIESALALSYPHTEVIVIDDGSTDESLQVIRSFGEKIRWETGPNRGGCAARNRGVELARGNWIQFLDSDDVLHSTKLERQLPLSMQHQDAIVYCDHVAYCDSLSKEPVLRSMQSDGLDPVVFVLQHRTMQTSAPLHRREWLAEAGGFRPGLPSSQEFDLHLRLAAGGRRFVHLPEVLFTVRRQAHSVSSDTGRTFAALTKFLPRIVGDLRDRGELSVERRREFAVYAAQTGRLCLRFGQEAAGLELLALAHDLDEAAADRAAYSLPARVMKRMFGPAAVERVGRVRRAFHRRMVRSQD